MKEIVKPSPIIKPLVLLINQSIDHGIVPDEFNKNSKSMPHI